MQQQRGKNIFERLAYFKRPAPPAVEVSLNLDAVKSVLDGLEIQIPDATVVFDLKNGEVSVEFDASKNMRKDSMKISFATLGCPNWTLEDVAVKASAMGFDGVELRGVKGEHIAPDESPADCTRIRKLFESKGVEIAAIMGYSSFTWDDPVKREENVASAIRFLDTARNVGCPVLRIFGGVHSKDLDLAGNIGRVAEGLRRVADHAERCGVKLALETHDDWCRGENLLAVQKAVASPALGFCWDVCNSFFVEPLEKTCESVRNRIYHVHFKDGAAGAEGHVASKLPGEGKVDLRRALSLLKQSGYDGYLSFEWEKKWQPDLAEPEIAFPHYVRFTRALLGEQK